MLTGHYKGNWIANIIPNRVKSSPSKAPVSSSLKTEQEQGSGRYPEAEVIELSPTSLTATNHFVCEICNKGFLRDQNLQLHRRGHNLPSTLKQRNKNEVVKNKVYICPEKSCANHDPSRALANLHAIKKHYSQKHGEKIWNCETCPRKYAVQSDWKAHIEICSNREYDTTFSHDRVFTT
ncbi:zinc finger protein JACKDAW-like [Helianthus annuus]|uniref:zinc finger protein JACKDAW-like n=1 Tax=Helianthus annuus TaxID=4232 RepID=UPI001652DD1E|nr:zinc finger protein JACKDAW-like [Helianthus annuus]